MRTVSRLLPLCVVGFGLGLGGCGIGSWFDGESEPPLPGERIAVLRSDATVSPDPAVAQVEVRIPRIPIWRNKNRSRRAWISFSRS